MTCDRCPLSLTCLMSHIDASEQVKLCLHCGRVWLPGPNVFICDNVRQLDSALAHLSPRDIRHCAVCKSGARQTLRSGVPIIKTVYFDLDDHDLHSA